jgi:hypothetical protein
MSQPRDAVLRALARTPFLRTMPVCGLGFDLEVQCAFCEVGSGKLFVTGEAARSNVTDIAVKNVFGYIESHAGTLAAALGRAIEHRFGSLGTDVHVHVTGLRERSRTSGEAPETDFEAPYIAGAVGVCLVALMLGLQIREGVSVFACVQGDGSFERIPLLQWTALREYIPEGRYNELVIDPDSCQDAAEGGTGGIRLVRACSMLDAAAICLVQS